MSKATHKDMLPLFKVRMASTVSAAVNEVLHSGFIGQGPKVDEFETKLKRYIGCKHLLTTNSATSALHLALHLLKKPNLEWPGLDENSEILSTPMTCTATNWPILANGLRIKWVDVDPKTINMDLDDLERKITKNTKVILVVHWGGYPIDLDRIEEIKRKTKNRFGFVPMVIEDCAHAFGSKFHDGLKVGGKEYHNFNVFSFQAIKHLTSVDGGALICPTDWYHERGKLLRWYGIDRSSDRKDFRCETNISEWGFKFHMNDVNAAIGIENLKNIDASIAIHKKNAAFYDTHLANIPNLTLVNQNGNCQSAAWIYSILVHDKLGFMNHMKAHNIMVSQVHERNDKHTCVAEYSVHLPSLDDIVGKLVCIPVGWWVTEEDRKYVVDVIKKGWVKL
jgi:dTDP-4-amino-4,6-dideoxygalactose transaminase